jgi:hypothetical protein
MWLCLSPLSAVTSKIKPNNNIEKKGSVLFNSSRNLQDYVCPVSVTDDEMLVCSSDGMIPDGKKSEKRVRLKYY